MVAIQIEERTAEGAPVSQGRKPGFRRDIGKVSAPVIAQEIVRMSVVGIVVGGRHRTVGIRSFPLPEVKIEIAVAIDVAGRESVQVGQLVAEAGHRRIRKAALARSLEQEERTVIRRTAHVVRDPVAREIRQDPALGRTDDRVGQEVPLLETETSPVPVNEVAARRHNLGEPVPVEIVHQDRTGARKPARRRLLGIDHHRLHEHGRTFSGDHLHAGCLDPFGNQRPVDFPLHSELAPHQHRLGQVLERRVNLKRDDGTRRLPTIRRLELGMVPFGLHDAPPGRLELFEPGDELRVFQRPGRVAQHRRTNPFHPPIGLSFAGNGRAENQLLELESLEDLERLPCSQLIPKLHEGLLVALGIDLVRENRLIQPLPLGLQTLHRSGSRRRGARRRILAALRLPRVLPATRKQWRNHHQHAPKKGDSCSHGV